MKRYARGKNAVAICERGGHKFPYRYLVIEPGTGLKVDKRWSDGKWNIVDHPQNYPPRNIVDMAPLKNATGPEYVVQTSLFTVYLTDNSGAILTDVSGNEFTTSLGRKFLLSYGTL